MKMKGYKVFIGQNGEFRNNAGMICFEGQTLETQDEIKPRTHGYHFAKRLEDTLRFGNAMYERVVICEVTSMGELIEYEDEYNEYFNLYVTSKLRIDRILTRKEIIEYADNLPEFRLKRFIQTMRLTKEEAEYFKGRSFDLDNYIDYYQFHNEKAFYRPYPLNYGLKKRQK